MRSNDTIKIGPEGLIWDEKTQSIIGNFNGTRIILHKNQISMQDFRWARSSLEMLIQKFLKEGFTGCVRVVNNEKNEATVSIRELQQREYKKIHVGEIYEGTIAFVTRNAIYVDVNGIKVRVYQIDCSRAQITELQEIFKIGEKTKIKIRQKDKEFPYHVYGSRKEAYPTLQEESEKYAIGDKIEVTVCDRLNYDGFWIEVTPGITGILNVPESQLENIETGQKHIARIAKKDLKRGLKCHL